MYQYLLAVQQFFLPTDSFFCCLQHGNIAVGRRSACKVLPHTLKYYITINSYFDEQLH